MMFPSRSAGISEQVERVHREVRAISWSGKATTFTSDWGSGTIRKRKSSGKARMRKIERPEQQQHEADQGEHEGDPHGHELDAEAPDHQRQGAEAERQHVPTSSGR